MDRFASLVFRADVAHRVDERRDIKRVAKIVDSHAFMLGTAMFTAVLVRLCVVNYPRLKVVPSECDDVIRSAAVSI